MLTSLNNDLPRTESSYTHSVVITLYLPKSLAQHVPSHIELTIDQRRVLFFSDFLMSEEIVFKLTIALDMNNPN